MNHWKSILNVEPTNWLLEDDNPSVRYFTLVDLLEKAENDLEVRKTNEEGVEYLLKHHIYKRSHDLSRVSKPGWLRLGFPLMYQDDILEILGILTRLGYHDEQMQEAIDVLISKQDREGKWKLENTFNGRFQINIEQKGKPSKWITLNALKVLKNVYS